MKRYKLKLMAVALTGVLLMMPGCTKTDTNSSKEEPVTTNDIIIDVHNYDVTNNTLIDYVDTKLKQYIDSKSYDNFHIKVQTGTLKKYYSENQVDYYKFGDTMLIATPTVSILTKDNINYYIDVNDNQYWETDEVINDQPTSVDAVLKQSKDRYNVVSATQFLDRVANNEGDINEYRIVGDRLDVIERYIANGVVLATDDDILHSYTITEVKTIDELPISDLSQYEQVIELKEEPLDDNELDVMDDSMIDFDDSLLSDVIEESNIEDIE